MEELTIFEQHTITLGKVSVSCCLVGQGFDVILSPETKQILQSLASRYNERNSLLNHFS